MSAITVPESLILAWVLARFQGRYLAQMWRQLWDLSMVSDTLKILLHWSTSVMDFCSFLCAMGLKLSLHYLRKTVTLGSESIIKTSWLNSRFIMMMTIIWWQIQKVWNIKKLIRFCRMANKETPSKCSYNRNNKACRCIWATNLTLIRREAWILVWIDLIRMLVFPQTSITPQFRDPEFYPNKYPVPMQVAQILKSDKTILYKSRIKFSELRLNTHNTVK